VVMLRDFLRELSASKPGLGIAAILTDDFRRFSQSPPKINVEILRQVGHDRFLTSIILELFYSPVIPSTHIAGVATT